MYFLKPNTILVLLCLFCYNFSTAQEEKEPTFVYPTFKVNNNYSLFGDKVKLRTAPNTTSDVVTLLRISDQVKLLEITDKFHEISTTKTPWCKVEYKGKTGYILAKFMAHAYIINSDTDFYFRLIIKESQNYLLIRTSYGDAEIAYHETTLQLYENSISFTVEDNKGLQNVTDILKINYHGDSCGAENGSTYFFLTEDYLLIHIANLSVSGDGGYFDSETFTFTTDEHTKEPVILFTKESGELIDGMTNWTETKTMTRQFEWDGTKLVPEFSKEFYKRKKSD
jgi:hypothetical protein